MFILRAAFWLALVILLLPANPETGEPAPRVGAIEALGAAQSAIGDLSSFCDRNPDVCATGSTAVQVFTQKVRYGADLILDYFDDRAGSDRADTLSQDDRRPSWRGPSGFDGMA